MILGIVKGSIWATRKLDSFEGKKLLIVEPLDENHQPAGGHLIAVDTVDAGVGDTVMYATSREASIPLEDTLCPADAAIVGVVDRIDT